jgi:hypothetical protein
MRGGRASLLFAAVLAAATGLAGPARADDRIVAVIEPGELALDPDLLRAALAAELGSEVISLGDPQASAASGTIAISIDGGHRALIYFFTRDGRHAWGGGELGAEPHAWLVAQAAEVVRSLATPVEVPFARLEEDGVIDPWAHRHRAPAARRPARRPPVATPEILDPWSGPPGRTRRGSIGREPGRRLTPPRGSERDTVLDPWR